MPNLIPTNINVPAGIASRLGKSRITEAATAGISSNNSAHPRISIKGSRFRIVEDGTEAVLPDTTVEVVVVGVNPRLSKTYYAAAWDKDAEPAAPDCFSLDGVRPDASASNPQDSLCATCPQNAWGSKISPSGGKIKACADQKRLAVVAADDPTGTVYLLSVTPAAFKDFNAYVKQLQMRSFPIEYVRTRLSFDTDASFPKLTFAYGGFIDDHLLDTIDEVVANPMIADITGEATEPAELAVPKPVLVKAEEPKPEPEAKAAPKGFGAKKAPAEAPAVAKKQAMSTSEELASLLAGSADDE